MSEHHQHNHASQNIKVAFFLNLFFTIIEIIGGIYVNSIAILSDAFHDLGDSFSLGLSWYLQNKSNQPADQNFTYGYKRFSLLGALINAVVLLLGSTYVIFEAIERIITPQPSNAQGMMWFAFLGIAINGYAAWKLSHGDTVNEKVISWHLIEDVLGWVAILIASIVMQFVQVDILDPILSLAITTYILWNAFLNLKTTLHIFLDGTPSSIDLQTIISSIESIEFVQSSHHTHVRSLDGEAHVFSTHIVVADEVDLSQVGELRKEIHAILKEYQFDHITIQVESIKENCSVNMLPNSHLH